MRSQNQPRQCREVSIATGSLSQQMIYAGRQKSSIVILSRGGEAGQRRIRCFRVGLMNKCYILRNAGLAVE